MPMPVMFKCSLLITPVLSDCDDLTSSSNNQASLIMLIFSLIKLIFLILDKTKVFLWAPAALYYRRYLPHF